MARGRTVVELSRAAGLSRRYVTQLEAGLANPSLLKLLALSDSLGVELRELCDLPRVGGGGRLALVGLRGAGKTSVGRALAGLLGAPFVELDERVEELAGMSLAELFDLRGEATYRRLEREALELVLGEGERQVIAAGGSIVTAPATFARLRAACRTVWLRASPQDHLERVLAQGDRRPTEGRPRAMEELQAILERREPAYARCDLVVDTSDTDPQGVVGRIASWLGEPSAEG